MNELLPCLLPRISWSCGFRFRNVSYSLFAESTSWLLKCDRTPLVWGERLVPDIQTTPPTLPSLWFTYDTESPLKIQASDNVDPRKSSQDFGNCLVSDGWIAYLLSRTPPLHTPCTTIMHHDSANGFICSVVWSSVMSACSIFNCCKVRPINLCCRLWSRRQ